MIHVLGGDYVDDSILNSIKAILGLNIDDDVFDQELIMLINTFLMTLQQIGVGPQDELFSIEDSSQTWSDYLEEPTELPMVKNYIGIRVRLIFDPPQSSSLDQALRQEIAEYEWRLNIKVDDYHVEEDTKEDEEDT